MIYQALCFCHSQMGHIPSTQWMHQHFPLLVLLQSRSWFLLSSTFLKVASSLISCCNSVAQDDSFPRSWRGSLHHNVFVYPTEDMSSSASLLHANLLQSSDTVLNLLKSILPSTDEESTNIILMCYERSCLLSLQEWSVCFIPIIALIGALLM